MSRVYQEIIAEHLALAEQNVSNAKAAVERQREVMRRLSGHDSARAKAWLVHFIRVLKSQIADRDRLQRELKAGEQE
jgi:hypothetical protein